MIPKSSDASTMPADTWMSRLAAPWQLIRIAIKTAQTDDVMRVAATPYAPAVDIVLGEIERLVGELQGAMDRIRATHRESASTEDDKPLKAAIEAAIALILEEHQDWHLLVRPHTLPLA